MTAFYEQAIENDPDNLNNYWYLGLGYLLLGKEEETHTPWFLMSEIYVSSQNNQIK